MPCRIASKQANQVRPISSRHSMNRSGQNEYMVSDFVLFFPMYIPRAGRKPENQKIRNPENLEIRKPSNQERVRRVHRCVTFVVSRIARLYSICWLVCCLVILWMCGFVILWVLWLCALWVVGRSTFILRACGSPTVRMSGMPWFLNGRIENQKICLASDY